MFYGLLGAYRKCYSILVIVELLDLIVVTGFLVSEVIGGYGYRHCEAFAIDFLKLFQLMCVTTQGGTIEKNYCLVIKSITGQHSDLL